MFLVVVWKFKGIGALICCGCLEKRESGEWNLFQPTENPDGYQMWGEPQMVPW